MYLKYLHRRYIMDNNTRKEILNKSKIFFKEKIALNHKRNTEKLVNLKQFHINPFLYHYLAKFAFGNDTHKDIARALIYPRILGTSITTTFGTQLQYFCSNVLSGYASTTPGIDIEFIDSIDGYRKYCQIKSGPNTINHDDVKTIKDHFIAIRNLARTNRLENFNPDRDCIVGVFYGEEYELSASYKKVAVDYPVHIGKDFWSRLTGDDKFYDELINAFAEVAIEINGKESLEKIITKLAEKIKDKYD